MQKKRQKQRMKEYRAAIRRSKWVLKQATERVAWAVSEDPPLGRTRAKGKQILP